MAERDIARARRQAQASARGAVEDQRKERLALARADRDRRRRERAERERQVRENERVRRENAKRDRDQRELRQHGFAGASKREVARRDRDAVARAAEKAAPAKRGEPTARPASPDQARRTRPLAGAFIDGEWTPFREGDAIRRAAFKIPGVEAAGDEAGAIVTGLPKFGYTVTKALAQDASELPKGVVTGKSKGFSRTKEALVDPVVADLEQRYGPLAPGGRPASETWEEIKKAPLSTLLDALFVASAPVAAGAKVSKFAKASGGPRARLQAARALPEPRTIRYGAAETQVPTGASPLMNLLRRRYDKVSEAHPDAPLIGAATRVPKQAAKNLRQDVTRRAASFADEVETIKRIEGPARTGFFWEAQMPEQLRGGVGLKMVAEDARALAAKALEEVADLHRRAVSAEAKGKGKVLRAAADRRARDARRLEIQAKKAEKALDSSYDPHAVTAATRLMDERERIFRDAGKLSDEAAGNSRSWLAQRLGVEGEGIYVGHRTRAIDRAAAKLGRTRPGLGGTRTPAGIGQKRTGNAYETGRVRTDPKVIIEDWQNAQRYDFHTKTKDFLAKMGDPIGPEGPRPGSYVVNPQGHRLRRQWKDLDEHQKAVAEGFKPEQVIDGDLRQYVENYIAKVGTPEADRLLKAAPEGVVQVPEQAVRQFLNTFTGQAGVAFGGTSKLATGVDITTDLLRASVIYANPGYIPANLIGNTAFALADQGPFYLPGNIARAAKVLHSDTQLKNLVLAEVGMGPTLAIHSGTVRGTVSKGTRGLARAVSRVGDDYIRAASWEHHARTAGYRTPKQQKTLLMKAARGDKQARIAANEIRDRMHVGMVDFERLTPFEQAFASRALFVWPWIRGATRYPFRFAVDHPARSAIAAHGSLELSRDPELQTEGMLPGWMSKAGAFPAGKAAGGLQKFINPRSTSTVSTPWEVLQTIGEGFSGEGRGALIDLTSPLARGGANMLTGRNRYGQRVGALGAAKEFGQNISPLATTVREVIDPSRSAKLYGPQTRQEVLTRRLGRGSLPIQVDLKVAREQAGRDLSPEKRVYRRVFDDRNEWHQTIKAKAPDALVDGRLAPPIRDAFNRKAAVEVVRARAERAHPVGVDRERAKYQGEVRLLHEWGRVDDATAKDLLGWSRTADEATLRKARQAIGDSDFAALYLGTLRAARDAFAQSGIELP